MRDSRVESLPTKSKRINQDELSGSDLRYIYLPFRPLLRSFARIRSSVGIFESEMDRCSPSLSIVCTYALSDDVQDEPLRRTIVWPILFAAFFVLSSLVFDVFSA